MSDQRCQQDEFAAFATHVSALNPNAIPPADAQDIANGATHIPSRVTDARRAGQIVKFVRTGDQRDWYWEMLDGTKIPHG